MGTSCTCKFSNDVRPVIFACDPAGCGFNEAHDIVWTCFYLKVLAGKLKFGSNEIVGYVNYEAPWRFWGVWVVGTEQLETLKVCTDIWKISCCLSIVSKPLLFFFGISLLSVLTRGSVLTSGKVLIPHYIAGRGYPCAISNCCIIDQMCMMLVAIETESCMTIIHDLPPTAARCD